MLPTGTDVNLQCRTEIHPATAAGASACIEKVHIPSQACYQKEFLARVSVLELLKRPLHITEQKDSILVPNNSVLLYALPTLKRWYFSYFNSGCHCVKKNKQTKNYNLVLPNSFFSSQVQKKSIFFYPFTSATLTHIKLMYGTWHNHDLKAWFIIFLCIFDTDVKADQPIGTRYFSWGGTEMGGAFCMFQSTDWAGGPWQVPGMAGSHSCCPSHTFLGARCSTAPSF